MRAIAVLLLVASARAYADPCDANVAEDVKAKVRALFAEGNELFAQQAYGPALDKYKAAIALADQPAIRLNSAVAEIRLDRILDAADDLDAALRCGPTAFSAERYQHALDDRQLLAGRIGHIEARCSQAGAAVSLDGKAWFACPGAQDARLLAGEHTIVAEAKGYLTISRRVVVAGGTTAHEQLALIPIESAVTLEYPSPRWLPWTALGAGVAVGVGGIAFWVSGRHEMDDYNAQFADLCATGCSGNLDANSVERQLAAERRSAQLKGELGLGMMIGGGAAALGSAAWAILNRPRRVLPDLEVTPMAHGVAVSGRF